ncbi:MAG: TOBE domain-containing protein, partial [Rectinema sp.]|nr:TOBE domain-containing protein [Rectinema sp.]
ADRIHVPSSSTPGTRVLVGMRPEHLVVEKERKAGSIPGQVNIIQHLGQVVRYEIKVEPRLSIPMLEVDMPGLVQGVSEGDSVFLSMKEHSASVYLPGEEHAE